jgi:Spy/CpxP family protein refolding chaperone
MKMLKNRYAILIAAAILGTSLCAGRVLAQEGPPPGGMMGGPPGGMMGGPPPVPPPLMMALRAANLTDDQKKQVHTIMDSNRTTTAPLMSQMHSIREQIADKLLSSGSVSASDLMPLLTQQEQIQQQLDTQMVSTAIQIRGVMTADQLSKVSAANDKLKAIHSEIESILGPPDAAPAP